MVQNFHNNNNYNILNNSPARQSLLPGRRHKLYSHASPRSIADLKHQKIYSFSNTQWYYNNSSLAFVEHHLPIVLLIKFTLVNV